MTSEAERRACGERLRAERRRRGWDRPEMARRLGRALAGTRPDPDTLISYLKRWETGKVGVSERYRLAFATALGMDADELFAHGRFSRAGGGGETARTASDGADELDALELSRRVAASDVSEETLLRFELAVDDLAVSYSSTPPAELLDRLRRHLAYAGRLVDAKKTLNAHRRLLVLGGWLSLLAATCHIDLHQRSAAAARLRTAAQLAGHAEHSELAAWCVETRAWQLLTEGDPRRAVALSQGAQEIAPRGSSAYLQATAQEGRAWARLSARRQTRAALDRVDRLASSLPMPERSEHHYRYDPGKAEVYAATTLSWLGDPAAEPYIRRVLARVESSVDGPRRPRRAAVARLDLSWALLAVDKAEEAAQLTLTALMSGVLVPSNRWRAAEVIAALEGRGVPEAVPLREAWRELHEPLPGGSARR